jgi:predicted metal-dependent phosphoesterase TrpH
MTLRPVGVALLLAGLTAGTLSDSSTHRSPIATGRGTVLRADFHVHAFPGDGVLPAWELRHEATRRGLDVIAITNHNQTLAARLLASESGVLPLVIRGQEVTAPSFHLIALGVREVVDWRLPLAEVIDAIHAQGGVAIAAHPVRTSWRADDPEAITALDGSEALHSLSATNPAEGNQLLEFHRTVRAKKPTHAAIGSSDFHSVAPIGRCSTYVLVDEVSERGVLSAIRRGQTAATDASGTLIGPAELVDLIREARTSRPSAEPSRMLANIAVTLVLGALVLLICVR